jgi:hypothetical protein
VKGRVMKKKILYLFIISLLLFVFITLGGVYSTEGPIIQKKEKPVKELKPDNNISISHVEVFGKLQRPPVIFDHKKHIDVLIKEGKNEWDTCKDCHPYKEDKKLLLFDFPKVVKGKDADAYMNSYHDECIGCHKEKSKEDRKSGPVTCGDCHMEKNTSIVLKYPIFEFDFKLHNEHEKKLKEKGFQEYCNLCHHVYNEELVYERGKEWSCYYCHDLEKKVGPVLEKTVQITRENLLSIKKVAHTRCLNCHLLYTKEDRKLISDKDKKYPLDCKGCHTGKYLTLAELEKVERPDSGQPERAFINIENAKMKGVSFNHKNHQQDSRTCRGCHHETLEACDECHTLIGSFKGKWVNIANAYHEPFSEKSCAGCHNKAKKDKKCAGCHSIIKPIDLESKGPKKEMCARCHTDKKEGLSLPPLLSTAGLDKEKVKKEVEIRVLEREYEPSKFPHLKIIEEFVKTSNESDLGRYFHARIETICNGCHHQSRVEAESKKDSPPYCRNCHSIVYDRQNRNRPKLIAAYHNQCIGCHKDMELQKGRKCEDCHKEKEKRQKYPLEVQRVYTD